MNIHMSIITIHICSNICSSKKKRIKKASAIPMGSNIQLQQVNREMISTNAKLLVVRAKSRKKLNSSQDLDICQ